MRALLLSGLLFLAMAGIAGAADFSGMPLDEVEARAKAGDANAQFELGMRCHTGNGGTRDDKLALGWFQQAASKNNAPAQRMLGEFYRDGIAVPANLDTAMDWLHKASVNGDIRAKTDLGLCYLNAKPRDVKKAFTCFLNAAPSDPQAAYQVANCYYTGVFVERNPVQAYRWCLIAQRVGPSDDVARLKQLLEMFLKPDEINQAKQLADGISPLLGGFIQGDDPVPTFVNCTSTKVPFEWDHECLVIQATINGKPGAFILDTGAQMTTLETDFAAECGIKGDDYLPAIGTGENVELGELASVDQTVLGSMVFKQTRVFITRTGLKELFDPPLCGIIGSDILQQLVLRINYVDQTIEFISPAAFQVPEGKVSALPIRLQRACPVVEGRVTSGKVESGLEDFGVDTGCGLALSLGTAFQQRNPNVKLQDAGKSNTFGIGGQSSMTARGYFSSFTMGDVRIDRPAAELAQTVQQAFVGSLGGVIGNEIFRRFEMTLDYPNRRMYLVRSRYFDDPYWDIRQSGLRVATRGAGQLEVIEVFPKSAAAMGGFHRGDVVLQVKELKGKLDIWSLSELAITPGLYHVRVRRGDEEIDLPMRVTPPPKQRAPAGH